MLCFCCTRCRCCHRCSRCFCSFGIPTWHCLRPNYISCFLFETYTSIKSSKMKFIPRIKRPGQEKMIFVVDTTGFDPDQLAKPYPAGT